MVTEMTFDQKLKIANTYLMNRVGITWDDLADCNSLHDCEDKECIIEYCLDRLEYSGFFLDII